LTCTDVYYVSEKRCRVERREPARSAPGGLEKIALIALCMLLTGCSSEQGKNEPSIQFSRIPPAAQGGRERIDRIAGRVIGGHAGQRVVVYAKSGPWWVQPWPTEAMLEIDADGNWSTTTHLGYEYAALLVNEGYRPPPTMDIAPVRGGSVVEVAISKGVGTLPPVPTKSLHFSGYDWRVRMISADRGGVNNLYDGENAWTDESGALHLRINKKGDRWACSEIEMSRSLGYGTYNVTVRDTSHLEPATVLSMHTFDESAGGQHYRELDIELSRWGDATSKNNAQYGIQPFYVPGNVEPFTQPGGVLTHSVRWESGRASFRTVRGRVARADAPAVSQHVFTSGVPSAGEELFQFMFYVVATDKNPLEKENEVVVEKFEYLP